MRTAVLSVLALLSLVPLARAEDWTLTNGTVYQGVTVLSHDDGFVTILDNDGGAKIPLRLLTPVLRARFNYDPTRAALAEKAAQDADAADLKAQAAAEQAQIRTTSPAPVPAAPIVAAQPIVTPPPPQQPQGLSDVERQQIQSQIQTLRDDIVHMERALDSEDHEIKRSNYSMGGYEQKVADDKQRIEHLQAQLNGKSVPAATTSSGSSTDIGDSFANVPRL